MSFLYISHFLWCFVFFIISFQFVASSYPALYPSFSCTGNWYTIIITIQLKSKLLNNGKTGRPGGRTKLKMICVTYLLITINLQQWKCEIAQLGSGHLANILLQLACMFIFLNWESNGTLHTFPNNNQSLVPSLRVQCSITPIFKFLNKNHIAQCQL